MTTTSDAEPLTGPEHYQEAETIADPSFYDREDVTAFDDQGNPLPCIGCGVSMVYLAASWNSGNTAKCVCPQPAHRLDDPEWYAVALDRLNRAAAALDEHTRPHALACTCLACEALRIVRGEAS